MSDLTSESGRDLCSALHLTARQQPVIWGGSQLHDLLGKPSATEPIGESWEVWEGDRIEAGVFTGSTLQEAVDRYPNEILGEIPLRLSGPRFPLLTKFIDAHEPLSVQAHPDDAGAQRLEGQPNGKTEAWYIIAASDDAWIIHGLNREIDSKDFRSLLESGKADDVLRKVKPAPGETIFVPAGTVHAIGPGVLLHEVQQTSDVTYRLYDWNRKKPGTDEPARELHLDKGLEVSWLKRSPKATVDPLGWSEGEVAVRVLLASKYFTVKQVTLPGRISLNTQGTSFHILTAIDGSFQVSTRAQALEMEKGGSMVLPACLGSYGIASSAAATVLVEYLSDVQGELVPEMHKHGLGRAEIEAFLSQFAPLASGVG